MSFNNGDRVVQIGTGRKGIFSHYLYNIGMCVVDFGDSHHPARCRPETLRKADEDFHAYLEIRNPRDPYRQTVSVNISNASTIRDKLEDIRIGDFFKIAGLGEFVVFKIEPFDYPMATYTHVELSFIVARVERPENKVVDIRKARERRAQNVR